MSNSSPKAKNSSKRHETKDTEENLSGKENEEELDSEDEAEENQYNLEIIEKNIERYNKHIKKFEDEIKRNMVLSKKFPKRQDEYKAEAVRALKKKKFYNKLLDRQMEKKYKVEMKIINNELKQQKKDLKEMSILFKKKMAILTSNSEMEEEAEREEELLSKEKDENNFEIDMDEKEVEVEYEKIISQPEIAEACEKFNLFKYMFEEE